MCSILRLAALMAIVGCAELIVVKTPRKHMNVELGKNALLECTFETSESSTDGLNIVWDFTPSGTTNSTQMFYYLTGRDVVSAKYVGRLEPHPSPGPSRNVSMLLRNMQVADSGLYTCDVRNMPDVYGTTEAFITVNVLQEPSKPFCSIHGTARVGATATLACHSEHGSPTPTYTWSRTEQTKTKTTTDAPTAGTLVIANITESDFGSYICTSQNVAGATYCELDFYDGATDGKLDSNDIGYIVAIVLGVVLGLVLIGIAIYFIVQAVNKKKYKGVRQTDATQMSAQ